MKLLTIILILIGYSSIAQVPNSSVFTLQDITQTIYGDAAAGRSLDGSFTSSNAAYFNATYGSKTMSPKTQYGFRDYHVTSGAPVVSTTTAGTIRNNTAISGGNVTSNGGASLTAEGVCWTTSSSIDPVATGYHTNDGTALGGYSSTLVSLLCNTTYYYRAYATNSTPLTGYGTKLNFTTTSWPEYYHATDFLIEDSRIVTLPYNLSVNLAIDSDVATDWICGTWYSMVITGFTSDYDGNTLMPYTLKDGVTTISSFPYTKIISGVPDFGGTGIFISGTFTSASTAFEYCRIAYYIKDVSGNSGPTTATQYAFTKTP